MKLLLDKGIIPYDNLEKSIDLFNELNEIHLIIEKKRENEWQTNKTINHHYYEDLANNPVELNYHSEYRELMDLLLADSRTLFLLERVTRNYFLVDSLFNKTVIISNYVYNSLELLKNNDIDMLLFQATPHHINSWVLAKTAEFLNLKILLIQSSPIPARFWLVEGLEEQVPLRKLINDESTEGLKYLDAFVSKLNGAYNNAVPSYEKKRIEERKGKYWSWNHEFKLCLRDPRKFLSISKKRSLYSFYKKSTDHVKVPNKYFVFFLHYQPERTSLPEGYNYSQQLFLIRELSMNIPMDYNLVVKEHPSTYTGVYDPRYRNIEFYESIIALKNVNLVPLNQNSFELIDNSSGVITITGTVGIESLLRGKSVFTFGIASYRFFKNVYNLKTDDLKTSLIAMAKSEIDTVQREAKKDLLTSLGISIGNADVSTDWYTRSIRQKFHNKLLNHVFINLKENLDR